jgi:serine/threonine protein kinase
MFVNKSLCDNDIKIDVKNQELLNSLIFKKGDVNIRIEHTNNPWEDDQIFFESLEMLEEGGMPNFRIVVGDESLNDLFVLMWNKPLGAGNYGEVVYYYDEENKVELCIKQEKQSQLYEGGIEEEISEILIENGCNSIPVKYVKNDMGIHYYIMEVGTGDLFKMLRNTKFTSNQLKHICEEIRKQLICLWSNGFVYTDLKVDNILFKCNSKNNFSVHLADLGSAVINNIGEFISSFKPPEYIFEGLKRDSNKILCWNLGMLMLQITNIIEKKNGRFSSVNTTLKLENCSLDPNPENFKDLEQYLDEACEIVGNNFHMKGYSYIKLDPKKRGNINSTLLKKYKRSKSFVLRSKSRSRIRSSRKSQNSIKRAQSFKSRRQKKRSKSLRSQSIESSLF